MKNELPEHQPEFLKGYRPNMILVGNQPSKEVGGRRIILGNDKPIFVSNTVFKEVGNAVTSVYNIRNRLAGIKLGDQKKQGINLTSNVGLKGWEANAVGSFSKRRGTTFNIKYQYSVEDMLMRGMGHRLRLVTNF